MSVEWAWNFRDAASRGGGRQRAAMSGIEVGIWLMANQPVRRLVDTVLLCEELGYSFVGITDGQMIWRDVYVALTAAALATSRIRLGPWVTNPITRHPTVTANAISTLDELSEGRAFLGIGNGDDSVRTIGRDHAKLDDLADAVTLIRQLATGNQVDTPHGTWSLASAQGRITIYWSAANPRSLTYGGRHSDGVVASGWLMPELLDRMRDYIVKGAASAGKNEAQVATIFNTAIVVDDDRARARQVAKPYVARALCYSSSTWLPDWSEEDMQRFRAQYDYYHHFRSDHEAADLVPEPMVTRKAVAGTPDECVELLRMVAESGFSRVALIPMGDEHAVLRALATRVLPKL